MTGFSADWLRQREPFDLAARSEALAFGFRTALKQGKGKSNTADLRITDLAAGSGANFRALAPLLQTNQTWLLLDHDPLLLAAQRTEIAQWARQQGWHCTDQHGALSIDTGTARWLVRGQQLDLAQALESLDLASCDGLVTTAFLDLVSAAWLDRLSTLLARVRVPLLATLTVDGRRTWHPARLADAHVAHAFLSHQQGDKGFGPSLGVAATHCLANNLSQAGYRVSTGASDWVIGQEHREMLANMAEEAAAVAREADPAKALDVASWLTERISDLQRGSLSLEVGHLDLLAVPEDSRP